MSVGWCACDDITGTEPSCLAAPVPDAGDLTLLTPRSPDCEGLSLVLARPPPGHYLSLVYIASGVVLWYLHTTIHRPPFFHIHVFSLHFSVSKMLESLPSAAHYVTILIFSEGWARFMWCPHIKIRRKYHLNPRKCHTNHIVMMHSNLSE